MPMKSWIALVVCLCVVLTTGASAIARGPVALPAADASMRAPALEVAGRDELSVSAPADEDRADTCAAQARSDGQDGHSPPVSRFAAMSLTVRWPASPEPRRASPPPRVPARPPCARV